MKLRSGFEENSWMKKYFTELLLFFFSLAAAYFIGWNNTDLIWCFWITSLVVGYVTIFRTTLAPLYFLAKIILSPEEIKKFKELPHSKKLHTIISGLIIVPIFLFQFVFMSFHFCIFHFLLAYLLQELMPHLDISNILADANIRGFYIYIQIIKTLLMSYWIIVFQKLIFDYRASRKNGSKEVSNVQSPGIDKVFSIEGIIRPYVQVARIHLAGSLVLLLTEFETNQYLIYVMIFSLFFFPIPSFRKVKK